MLIPAYAIRILLNNSFGIIVSIADAGDDLLDSHLGHLEEKYGNTEDREAKGGHGGSSNGLFIARDDTTAFLNRRGKGHRSHSSGLSSVRNENPTHREGNLMTCGICNSEAHFRK